LTVIDFKGCFFSIPLHRDDAHRFAFSIHNVNMQMPLQRFHWTVLPQGMKNSPTICQWFVAKALSPIRLQFSQVSMYHYMDDLLLADRDQVEMKTVQFS
ncbi:POK19 protein, partial [Alcedo cyanopectus]|nr:POK19 protein [Ceyx cyanopectus]